MYDFFYFFILQIDQMYHSNELEENNLLKMHDKPLINCINFHCKIRTNLIQFKCFKYKFEDTYLYSLSNVILVCR
jgi:hypothetical protein